MSEMYAGDLTSDHLGRTVRVAISKHVTIQDALEAVGHVSIGGKESKTVLVFQTVNPDNMSEDSIGALFAQLTNKRGFLLPHTHHVEVLL
jgi:hypothetical protein